MFNVPRTLPRLACVILAAGVIAAPALAGEFVFVPERAAEGLESKPGRFDTLLVHPETDLRAYSQVAIRSVRVKPRDRDFARRLSSQDRRVLTRDFRKQFADGLGDRLAKNGGEGTLVLSAAITHAWPNRDITGRWLRSRGGSPASSSTTTGVGSASFEAVLRDARTGDIVAVIADRHSGQSFTSNINVNTRWGDAREGFRRWGRNLGRELGGRTAS
ncbi:MAG: DUF3313 family protein [Alphaproteobacteria bacterium]